MTPSLLRTARDFFVSLRLTVVLLTFSVMLVFVATLDQTALGVWGVQQKWFHSFVVYQEAGGFMLPVFPGGYLIGGLLLLNLLAAHIYRFKATWAKSGIFLTHSGLILLLIGELLSGLWQEDYAMRIDTGETKSYAESFREFELALVNTDAPGFDEVVVIPASLLARRDAVQHPKLPFLVAPKAYYPNSRLLARPASGAGPTLATSGAGLSLDATPLPRARKDKESDSPSAFVEFRGAEGTLGTFLVSDALAAPQIVEHAGQSWSISLRSRRLYRPFSLTLLQFNHDRYPGTEIPRNFSSLVRLRSDDGHEDREILISMNQPLRHDGLAFYQAGFANNDRTTVLQVVRNPSWMMPYVSCAIMGLGLLVDFTLRLAAFARRRRAPRPAPAPADAAAVNPASPRPLGKSLLPRLLLLVSLAFVAWSLRPAAAPAAGDFDITGFSRQPTLVNGRVKPLDTVARSSLLSLQGRQRVLTETGALAPAAWLLDVLFRPELADTYQTFEIVHPELLTLTKLTTEEGAGGKRFSLRQLLPSLHELDRQSRLADEVESPLRTPFQRAVLRLRDNIVTYQRLQASLVPPGESDYLERALAFPAAIPAALEASRAKKQGLPHDAALAAQIGELDRLFTSLDALGQLLPIPPETDADDASRWRGAGASLRASLSEGRVNPAVVTYARIGLAWRAQDAAAFNEAVRAYRELLEPAAPQRLRRSDVEARFNAAQPFYISLILYVAVFLLAVFSWLRWPEALGRSAFLLLLVAFVLTTAGIATRMWLENRPPVTNLYSSALFVGWGSVGLCLVLESVYRNAIGACVGGLIGFAALLIAHHLSLGGDTLEMMRAVLDSNFWLATHVVTITAGYSAAFLAGFLGLVYVFRGVLTRSLDGATAASLERMVYGIVCFATFFSFIGTVLGGIWADQSWGRFWGWDPKENGALMIVLWNALILHARRAGLVKTRGLMNLAIFGNVITAWSWFGVNMLGVGLHSYGFMDQAFWWLMAFVASQAAFILLAALPTTKWRSSPTAA